MRTFIIFLVLAMLSAGCLTDNSPKPPTGDIKLERKGFDINPYGFSQLQEKEYSLKVTNTFSEPLTYKIKFVDAGSQNFEIMYHGAVSNEIIFESGMNSEDSGERIITIKAFTNEADVTAPLELQLYALDYKGEKETYIDTKKVEFKIK